jgi:hypothetical protein
MRPTPTPTPTNPSTEETEMATDNEPIFEHVVTYDGWRLTAHYEWDGTYFPNPPSGDGWEKVRTLRTADNHPCILWRRQWHPDITSDVLGNLTMAGYANNVTFA